MIDTYLLCNSLCWKKLYSFIVKVTTYIDFKGKYFRLFANNYCGIVPKFDPFFGKVLTFEKNLKKTLAKKLCFRRGLDFFL